MESLKELFAREGQQSWFTKTDLGLIIASVRGALPHVVTKLLHFILYGIAVPFALCIIVGFMGMVAISWADDWIKTIENGRL